MSPLGIEIMLHYYCSIGPYGREYGNGQCSSDAPAVGEIHQELVSHGLLNPGHTITERGVAYIGFLEDVPWPVIKWVLP